MCVCVVSALTVNVAASYDVKPCRRHKNQWNYLSLERRRERETERVRRRLSSDRRRSRDLVITSTNAMSLTSGRPLLRSRYTAVQSL